MAVFECPKCGVWRSRSSRTDCNVCWLLEDFIVEHDDGLHEEKPTHGCGKCAPILRAQIAPEALNVMRASDDTLKRAEARMRELSVLSPRRAHTSSAIEQATEALEKAHPSLHRSHRLCDHENTKAARAKCRAQRRKAG